MNENNVFGNDSGVANDFLFSMNNELELSTISPFLCSDKNCGVQNIANNISADDGNVDLIQGPRSLTELTTVRPQIQPQTSRPHPVDPGINQQNQTDQSLIVESIPAADPTESSGSQNDDPSKSTGDLEQYLQNNLDGRSILMSFSKEKFLRPRLRNLLVRTIIAREKTIAFDKHPSTELLTDFTISRQRFEELASQICEVFPNENRGTYFTPFRHVRGTKINASGKLWDHYNYCKGVLRDNGLLLRKSKNSVLEPTTQSKATETDSRQLNWLETNVSPWNDVVHCWQASFTSRRNLFRVRGDGISVQEYFQKFKCLKDQKGSELLKLDFANLHPGKENNLFTKWKKIKSRLIELLTGTRKPSSAEKQVEINEISRLEDENQDAGILNFLPSLIKPPYINVVQPNNENIEVDGNNKTSNKRKRNIKKRKASVLETQEAFFLLVPNVSNLERLVDKRKTEASRQKTTLQPFPVLVGSLTHVEDAYVIVENCRYRVGSTLSAIDLVLKACFVLDCEYAPAASQIWLFIQKCLYDIHEVNDVPNSSVTALIGEMTL